MDSIITKLRVAGIQIDNDGTIIVAHLGHTLDLYEQYLAWSNDQDSTDAMPYGDFVDTLLECGYQILSTDYSDDEINYLIVRPVLN